MDLSTTYLGMRLPHPLIVGAGPLGDDLDVVRALEDAGAAMLVLRSLYEEEITGEQMDAFFNAESHSDSFAEAASFAPEPELALGPDEYLEHLRLIKSAVAHPGDGVAQRRHARRLDLLRAAARAGRRGRPRAAHLSRRQRHDVERGRSRTSGHRDRARGEAQPCASRSPSSSRRSSPPSPISPSSSTRPAPTGSCCSRAFTASTSTSRSSRSIRTLPLSDSSELPLRLRGAAALAGRDQGVHRDHRRRPHRARRHQGDDGRRACHADGLGAAPARSRSPAHGPQRDRVVDAGARMELARRDARQHEPRADSRSGGVRTRELPDGAEMTRRHQDADAYAGVTSFATWRVVVQQRAVSSCDVSAWLRRSRRASPARSRPVPSRLARAGRRCPGSTGATTGGLCRERHVRGLSLRQGRLAQGHATRPGEESAIAGGDPGLRELPRSGAGARGRRREGEHPEVRADQARRDEPDLPDVPQPRQSRGMGGQRARAPQSLVHARATAYTARSRRNGSSSRRPRRSSAPRAIGCR